MHRLTLGPSLKWIGTEQPTLTHQAIGAQNPTRLNAKVLTKKKLSSHIHCTMISMSKRSLRWGESSEICSNQIDSLATNWNIPLNKSESIEKFCQSTSCKPGPDYSVRVRTQYLTWHGFSLSILPLKMDWIALDPCIYVIVRENCVIHCCK